ncbi:MAG: type II toxin-antitoxin system HicB family antitoxin [Calditrichaeota bacterium]|nr:type II toxin-antitoxin system HicB family antitoxin [Calditrichota bacterium]
MLTDYIKAAMRRAKYEIIDDPNPFYGEIPELPGVWANAATLEACRDELKEVVEEWIILGLKFGDPIPVLDEIDLNYKPEPMLAEAY